MARELPASAPAARDEAYERDYYAWAIAQARALHARNAAALDWDNLAEEVEGLARSEAHELQSRFEVLLVHLLKWQYQPERQTRSLTIREQRQRVAQLVDQNPGLKPQMAGIVRSAYGLARLVATRETRLAERTFPARSPWSVEQIIEPDFWPRAAGRRTATRMGRVGETRP